MRAMDFQQAISHALQRLATPCMVLKPEQRASIKAVYEGKDVFVWLPTGFGKSVCYEALPFVFDFKLRTNAPCLTLVISPLISLMVDQVVSLRRRGVKAAIINTSGTGVEKELLATTCYHAAYFSVHPRLLLVLDGEMKLKNQLYLPG